MQALLIPVSHDLFAVPLASVREVMAAPRLCFLPAAPATVLGLFNLRGEILPMFDTAALLGLGRLAAWPFAAVVRTPLGPAGIGGSGLPESTVLGEAVAASESHGTSGIYAVDDRLATLIDIEALLAPAKDGAYMPGGSGPVEPR